MNQQNEPVSKDIRCDVENCVYNDGCCHCTAGTIHVGCCSDEPRQTHCDTFEEL